MFFSILFPTQEQHEAQRRTEPPECFKDLNLNQIFAPIFKVKEEFELESLFYTPLHNPEIIAYRQKVMQELEDDKLRALLSGFSQSIYTIGRSMNTIRTSLRSEDKWRNNYLTCGKMLDYTDRYCRTISAFMEKLSKLRLHSEGLQGIFIFVLLIRSLRSALRPCTTPSQRAFHGRILYAD